MPELALALALQPGAALLATASVYSTATGQLGYAWLLAALSLALEAVAVVYARWGVADLRRRWAVRRG